MLLLCSDSSQEGSLGLPHTQPTASGTKGILTSKDAHVEPSIDVGELILKNTTGCVSCGAIQARLPWTWL